MTRFETTREALEAYLKGKASLDDVSLAANRSIEAYYEKTSRVPPELIAPRDANGVKQSKST